MINARAETVTERPAYRGAFERLRCLILADGFYEWQRTNAGAKQPFHITRAGGEPFAFAGLWSRWQPEEGEPIRSCTIITAAANEAVAPLHDRMPVILPRDAESDWLDAATPKPLLLELLHGLPERETALRPVSTAVNDARYDAPDCVADPLEDPQSALF